MVLVLVGGVRLRMVDDAWSRTVLQLMQRMVLPVDGERLWSRMIGMVGMVTVDDVWSRTVLQLMRRMILFIYDILL